jgi:hypothetical protein
MAGMGRARERGLHVVDELLGQWRGAGIHDLDRREVGRRQRGALANDHREHRRHRGQPRGAKASDGFDIAPGVELRKQDHARVRGQRDLDGAEPVHVEQRRGDEEPMARDARHRRADRHGPELAVV